MKKICFIVSSPLTAHSFLKGPINKLSKDYEVYLILNKKKFSVQIISVPGVFEIPVTISKNIKKFHGFVALGCVIKGETPHFDFISKATTDTIMMLSVNSKKPIGNGIITCLNQKQARARGNKGFEASEAAKAVLSQ